MSNQIAYLVGNTHRRDHLQWPTLTPAELASLGYTRSDVGLSLAQIMALAWRVKTFSLSGLCAVTGQGIVNFDSQRNVTASSSFSFGGLTMPVYKSPTDVATAEVDLIGTVAQSQDYGAGLHYIGLRNYGFFKTTPGIFAPPSTQFFVIDHWANSYFCTPPSACDPPSGSDSGNTSTVLQLLFNIFGNETDKEYVSFTSGTNLFRPFVTAAGMLFSTGGLVVSFFIPNNSANGNGSLTIDLGAAAPPIIYPMQITCFLPEAPTTNISGTAVSMTLTATEFWPYKNSAGDPIYNSLTGAQLVDPFS